MDSRDSSAPPSSATLTPSTPTSVGVGGDENDAVLTETTALAKEASLHFHSGRFGECLDVLHQLKQKKEQDPKVLHNIAITEFFRDGCSDPNRLLEVLNNVRKKSEEVAQSSGEQAESATTLGNKVTSASKGSGALTHQLSAANNASVIYMDESDTAVAALNIAIIWFHLHEYSKASSVLEALYHNIEPIDETIALHVCLLVLDVALVCQDASKVADVLLYLEKAFGVGSVSQGDTGNSLPQQSANPAARSLLNPSGSAPIDASNSDIALSANSLENSLSRSLSISEETLEYESMFSLDVSGRKATRPGGFSRTTSSRSLSLIDLKLQWQLYKVRFLLLTRNLKLAKREVKLVMNIARERDSSTALILKAQLECARGNPRKAIKLLMASSNQAEIGVSSMFNNLGCVYHELGKHHTSLVLFSKALSSTSSLRKEKPLRLSTSCQDKSLLIMYNCGVQQLACENPLLAARCFQKASLVFYNRPILWLRLAECCLMALRKGLRKPGGSSSEDSEILVSVVGKGKWRHLAIENVVLKNQDGDSVAKDSLLVGNNGDLKLSLSLARLCLLNSLHLLDQSESSHLKSGLPHSLSLDENESNHKNLTGFDPKASSVSAGSGQVNTNGDIKDQKGGASQDMMQSSISYYQDIRRKENQMIKQAVLADLSYLELEMENPEKALSTARSILQLPECSRIYVFLAHVYAAEALCMLNNLKEATEQLSMYLSGDNVELPFTLEDCEQLRAEKAFDPEESNGESIPAVKTVPPEESRGIVFLSPDEARGSLYANFAIMHALEGELERAQHFVSQALALVPENPHASLTAAYIDLALGKSQAAINKLKRCSRVRFQSTGGIESNKS